MRRGFKAEAERRAASARADMGLSATEKLCPWRYAEHLGVLVYEASELDLEPDHASQLLVRDPDSWSGMTLLEEGVHVVVLNSTHLASRRASTLMHELAHIILEHAPAEVDVSPSGLVLLSDYSTEQEDEADWLGAALLLPEPALILLRGQGYSIEAIAQKFGVSDQICHWRCRMTGVEKRLAFRRRAG